MKYRRLGKYGIKLPEVSLGAWLTYGGSVENSTAIECIHEAIENKITFIDVADIYARGKAEEVVGSALAGDNYPRKDLVISSKVFWSMTDNPNDHGLSRKHIMDSIEGSLKRLQTDYLDIYFCHRFDYETPLEETLTAMDDLISAGKIRYWGTSVWSAAQLERAIGICKDLGLHYPAVEQPRYNMLDRYIELEILNTTNYHGMGVVTWSPLAQGLLTGKYNDSVPAGSRGEKSKSMKREMTEENMAKIKKICAIAKNLDVKPNQLALAWILQRSEITSVITGATHPDQVKENANAADIKIEKDISEQLESILNNKPQLWPTYEPATP